MPLEFFTTGPTFRVVVVVVLAHVAILAAYIALGLVALQVGHAVVEAVAVEEVALVAGLERVDKLGLDLEAVPGRDVAAPLQEHILGYGRAICAGAEVGRAAPALHGAGLLRCGPEYLTLAYIAVVAAAEEVFVFLGKGHAAFENLLAGCGALLVHGGAGIDLGVEVELCQ